MPLYSYKCDGCSHEFDKRQRYEEKSLKRCPKCKKMKLYKVYSAPYVFDATPKTLGSLADRNVGKLGNYTKDRLAKQHGKKFDKPKDPWWRKGPIKKELVTGTKQENANYIEDGVLPPKKKKAKDG